MRAIRRGLSARFWVARRREVLERDGYRCRRCGYSAAPARLEVAHVIGLGSRGTRNDPDCELNSAALLVTLCGQCHRAKDSRHAWAWADIDVAPDPELARRYGWREAVGVDSPEKADENKSSRPLDTERDIGYSLFVGWR